MITVIITKSKMMSHFSNRILLKPENASLNMPTVLLHTHTDKDAAKVSSLFANSGTYLPTSP